MSMVRVSRLHAQIGGQECDLTEELGEHDLQNRNRASEQTAETRVAGCAGTACLCIPRCTAKSAGQRRRWRRQKRKSRADGIAKSKRNAEHILTCSIEKGTGQVS